MRTLIGKAVWVWFLFLLLAVLNGLARETVYIPTWGGLWGRVAGTAILIVAMLIVTAVFLRRNAALLTRVRLVEVGLLWLGLSLFFEFAVSRWVMEEPWQMIVAHYDVTAGRLRVLVRLVELAAPVVLGGRAMARYRLRQAAAGQPIQSPAQPPEAAPPAEGAAPAQEPAQEPPAE